MSLEYNSSAIQLKAHSLPSWATVSLNLESLNEFVVVDVETNGLEYYSDSMLSIAAVRFINGSVAASFYSLMKPDKKSAEGTYNTQSARAVNKITEHLIENAPSEKEVMEAFSKFVGVSPTVGHNIARFDARFIEKALKRHKISSAFGWQMFDTFSIARSVGGFEKNSLEIICRDLGIENKAAHHALADCLATGEVMVHFVNNFYSKVLRHQFTISERLRSEHIERSPVMRTKLNGEQVAEAGLSDRVSKLAVAQTIIDCGGKYLHNPLVGTSKFFKGDLEAEDRMIRKTSKFGGASGRLKKAQELADRPEKKIEFSDLNEFVETVAVPHLIKVEDMALDIEVSPDTVITCGATESLASMWRWWSGHVISVDGLSVQPVPIHNITTQVPVEVTPRI